MEIELSMVKLGSLFKSVVSFFRTVKRTKPNQLLPNLDLRKPFAGSRFKVRPSEAGKPRCSVGIIAILNTGCGSKIANSVMVSNMIFVIYLVRPYAIDIEPCKMMFVVLLVVNDYLSITMS